MFPMRETYVFHLGNIRLRGVETYVFGLKNIEGGQTFFLYHRESLENNKRVKYESVRST